jgi:hypothetical protein
MSGADRDNDQLIPAAVQPTEDGVLQSPAPVLVFELLRDRGRGASDRIRTRNPVRNCEGRQALKGGGKGLEPSARRLLGVTSESRQIFSSKDGLAQTSVPEPGPFSQDLVSESLRACAVLMCALWSVASRLRRSSRLVRRRARRSLSRSKKPAIFRPFGSPGETVRPRLLRRNLTAKAFPLRAGATLMGPAAQIDPRAPTSARPSAGPHGETNEDATSSGVSEQRPRRTRLGPFP